VQRHRTGIAAALADDQRPAGIRRCKARDRCGRNGQQRRGSHPQGDNVTLAAEQDFVDLYRESLQLNSCDLHSITGLGWVALVYDGNDSLAERLFQFVHLRSNSPDILLKLSQLEGYRRNAARQKEYASQFVKIVTDSVYGKMYNKYLIDLYTGILPDPQKAIKLSLEEVNDRPTPQSWAWYAWSLYSNKEYDKALNIYKGSVSGKPLEALELYYMGRMMQGMEKSYNAHEYFSAAWKNKYDLDPQKLEIIKEGLDL